MAIRITYNPAKRDWTLRERGLDFDWVPRVFAGRPFERVDNRRDYGEVRNITIGFLHERMVVVVWTQRGNDRHVISTRKANEREKKHYGKEFGAYQGTTQKDR